MSEGCTAQPVDRVFDVLSHPYRRRIVLLVAERNPRDEEEFVLDDITAEDDFDMRTTGLYHTHIPKLAAAGYIEWNKDDHTIRRGPNFEEAASLLRLMDEHQDELPEGWP